MKPEYKKIMWGGGLGLLIILYIIGSFSNSTPQTANLETIQPEQNQANVVEAVNSEQTIEVKENQDNLLYSVVKVVDGDTLSIDMDGKSQTIRLIGLNTPETVDPRKPVECFGKEASNKAKELLIGKKARIEKDPSQGDYDKYQRLLAYVFLEDGTNFNKWMIENGYGYEYTYDLPYKYQKEFKLAESQAKSQKKGLWADGICDQPKQETKTTTPAPTTSPKPASQPKPQPTTSSNYICSYNAYNCSDFSTHAEAQAAFEACGGTSNDIHRLDQDKDGIACETLP